MSDSIVLHDIVPGDDAATITIENGLIKSVANSVKEITEQIAQAEAAANVLGDRHYASEHFVRNSVAKSYSTGTTIMVMFQTANLT